MKLNNVKYYYYYLIAKSIIIKLCFTKHVSNTRIVYSDLILVFMKDSIPEVKRNTDYLSVNIYKFLFF